LKKNFDVFLPIDKVEKSGEGDEATYTISGMASTSDKDLQGETIDPQGINADYLLSDGWVDFEHDRDQVIGVPTENTYVDSKGLFLEAKLFKNMPQVQDIIKLYHNIKDNHIDRQLGFSIEGNVLERDASDDSIIRQVQITGVAVTKNPANTHATWELVSKSIFGLDNEEPVEEADTTDSKPMLSMTVKLDKTNKALTAGHGITPSTQNDGGAFRTEALSGQLVSLAENMKQARKIGLRPVANSVADILAHKDSGDDVMILFLQLFEGLSYNDSQAVVHAINTNNLTTSRLERILSGADGVTDD
jgi:phage head maturation protease